MANTFGFQPLESENQDIGKQESNTVGLRFPENSFGGTGRPEEARESQRQDI